MTNCWANAGGLQRMTGDTGPPNMMDIIPRSWQQGIMRNKTIMAALLLAGANLSSPANCSQPALSPAELQTAQMRDYSSDKSAVFGATLSALQDEGFSIASADVMSGFVSAESASTPKTNFWEAMTSVSSSGNTRATIVIEAFSPSATHVRISLISTKNLSGASGQSSRDDQPIATARPYRELYARIDAGVRLRAAMSGNVGRAGLDVASVTPIAELGQPVLASASTPDRILLANAKAELLREGYQIIAYDERAGSLATEPKPSHLTPEIADCGRMLGISYLRDKRAATDTQVFVDVKVGSVSVRTAIDGVYRTGYGNPDKPLICKSRGVIEADLLAKFAR